MLQGLQLHDRPRRLERAAGRVRGIAPRVWVPEVHADAGPARPARPTGDPTRPRATIESRPAVAPPTLSSLDGPLDVSVLDSSADGFFSGSGKVALEPGPAGVGQGSAGGEGGLGAPGDRAPEIRVGGLIQPPAKLRHLPPVYPELARRVRQQGRVVLECTIDVHGRVVGARVVRGVPLLDQAALDAVREWLYAPTLLNGVPVPVVMTVTVTFRLD